MAEDFLEEIYHEAILRTELKCLLDQLLSGNDGYERKSYSRIVQDLEVAGKKYAAMNPEEGLALCHDLNRLQEYSYSQLELADFIEANILSRYEKYLGQLNKICVDDGQGYCMESSLSGFLTIKNTAGGNYYHSKNDPMWEARQIAEKIYDPAKKGYYLLGCGLGYIAYQLYRVSDGSVPVKVYEYEEKMVQYARNYGVLDWIPEECISVTVDADVLPFLLDYEQEGEDYGYYIFEPEVCQAPEDAREIVRTLLINGNTIAVSREAQRRNFYRNIQSDARPLSCFPRDGLGDRFIVVAGGPSLDDRLDFLRQQKGRMPIIAVGAIFSKLISCGVTPDMVVMLDPNPVMMRQMDGVEDQKVPLFLGITAYWKLARSYKGEKYLVPTDRDMPETRYYVEKCGGIYLECPGTVTILAVSLALYFGAKEIYLLGVDFAFPGNKYYAAGATGAGVLGEKGGLFAIESVGGGQVYTDKPMLMFRDYMEQLIAGTQGVTFYNLSTGGARIKGTVEDFL